MIVIFLLFSMMMLTLAYITAWLVSPKFRTLVEEPKHHFRG